MPHERVKKGLVMPLQTPQAFTNRAYRLRVPNQIPATKPKKGSNTYKDGILRSLGKERATTTEGLSTLNSAQVKRVRQRNKGQFVDNSRYVIKTDDHPKSPPASRKRSRSWDDDTQSEPEQEAKRPCTRRPQSMLVGSGYNLDANAYWEAADISGQPTDTAEQWIEPVQDYLPANTVGSLQFQSQDYLVPLLEPEPEYLPTSTVGSLEDQTQEFLVPLFATIDDQGLAMVENVDWTSADAVILARRNGNQQTRQIGVYWYSQNTPRHVGPDGNIVEDVADLPFMNHYVAEEPIPSDFEPTWQDESAFSLGYGSTQCSIPTAIETWLEDPSRASSQGFPPQASNYSQSTASSSAQTPQSALFPIGRYQTESDSAEEVWRNQYGRAGF